MCRSRTIFVMLSVMHALRLAVRACRFAASGRFRLIFMLLIIPSSLIAHLGRSDISLWPYIRQSIISQTWLRISHDRAHCNEPGLSLRRGDWDWGGGRRAMGTGTNLITRALAVLANVSPAARRMSAPANAEHPLQLPPAANC